jgi:hypothetical protein
VAVGGRLLLVTARHVVLPGLDDDEGFERKEGPEEREEGKRHDVLVLNDASFKNTSQLLRRRSGCEV